MLKEVIYRWHPICQKFFFLLKLSAAVLPTLPPPVSNRQQVLHYIRYFRRMLEMLGEELLDVRSACATIYCTSYSEDTSKTVSSKQVTSSSYRILSLVPGNCGALWTTLNWKEWNTGKLPD